ncbi:uncharacterized protein DUF4062 [Asanoa ferruginea]|uniref:Uncharacterized protein DUF4062 n=1 Tax=Asanoa ferruginea TaxID=53367 RepID=A0A3D9ZYV8_9ACTN|nr:DUF4062 domain-containing protein [Asanoa ferruginea]REG02292.1 uncharacterized protein DUF4062 [Asanoa ferruginea]GIF46529.1 hypothetical protein Afe04nite_10680 [Asanoa ferruginea]
MTAFAPRHYPGVMVSSTFQDFVAHREVLIRVIAGQGLHPVAMEQDSARPAGTVIDSSLEKVRDAAAYVGIIGHRYGNVPDSADLNPAGLSLTEMEFREARRLGRPILLFVMGPDHEVKPSAVEIDAAKLAKLAAFREDAKRVDPDSPVHRIYKVFNSLGEFEVAATQSVAELRRLLDTPAVAPRPSDGIPTPPKLYAEPHYIGSHRFVGRAAQLDTLTDWAATADPHPLLLFEAIGGSGKSMLTWEWTTQHAPKVRTDWAGVFWYSFYEKGAVMADFCRCALAYMTGQPLDVLRQKRQRELTDQLVRQLRARPWLVILDGLERVLVAYHRYDAAQLADEEAGRTDEIAERDPCTAIRPADDDLLRLLAGAAPSKVLVTSRLVPRVLLNAASQAIPGVLHERLPGLRPADAESLLRTCAVRGDSARMQDFLRRHCDCHPLVSGVVAGLVNDYLPDRGNFDAWAADTAHGGRLDLADLDLAQKRNHILAAALASLSTNSRQLLSTLALLPEAVDFRTLEALSPHLPAEPRTPTPLPLPATGAQDSRREKERQLIRADHAAAARTRQAWEARDRGPEKAALARTIRDLEQRGLLQFDRSAWRYDLHPVVRAIASADLRGSDRDRLGQRVIDHFSGKRGHPYDRAETLDDLSAPLTVIRTLLRMGRVRQAAAAYGGELRDALLFNLEAYAEILSLVRPFFGSSWNSPSPELGDDDFVSLRSHVATVLSLGFEPSLALEIYAATLSVNLAQGQWSRATKTLINTAIAFEATNRLAATRRYLLIAQRLGDELGDREHMFYTRINLLDVAIITGRLTEAEELWRSISAMNLPSYLGIQRPGAIETSYATLQYHRGLLAESDLASAEELARGGRNRPDRRALHTLRGRWLLDQGRYAEAADTFSDALQMERETTLAAPEAEAWLALASVHLGQSADARDAAARISAQLRPPHLPLAELWHALRDPERATAHALEAYRWAWADGEPYVRRFELDRATALLTTLNIKAPSLPPYDQVQDPELPWTAEIDRAIEELQRRRGTDT